MVPKVLVKRSKIGELSPMSPGILLSPQACGRHAPRRSEDGWPERSVRLHQQALDMGGTDRHWQTQVMAMLR